MESFCFFSAVDVPSNILKICSDILVNIQCCFTTAFIDVYSCIFFHFPFCLRFKILRFLSFLLFSVPLRSDLDFVVIMWLLPPTVLHRFMFLYFGILVGQMWLCVCVCKEMIAAVFTTQKILCIYFIKFSQLR